QSNVRQERGADHCSFHKGRKQDPQLMGVIIEKRRPVKIAVGLYVPHPSVVNMLKFGIVTETVFVLLRQNIDMPVGILNKIRQYAPEHQFTIMAITFEVLM